MKKIKIKLLLAHINKIMTSGTETHDLPETNAAKKFLKSMGEVITYSDDTSISDIEVVDIASKKRIGLINAFTVLDKNTNAVIGNNDLEQGEYIALPKLEGLKQLEITLTTYVNNNNPAYKEREVGFKVITSSSQSQIVPDIPDTVSNISGYSQLSNMSNLSFAGGIVQDTSALITTHQGEVSVLNAQITALREECDQLKVDSRNQEQLLKDQIAQLTADLNSAQLQKANKENEVNSLNTQLNNANNQSNQKTAQINNLTNQLTQANTQKNNIQNQLNNVNYQLQTTTQQLATAQQNVGHCTISTSDVNTNGQSYVRIAVSSPYTLNVGNMRCGSIQGNYFEVKSQ